MKIKSNEQLIGILYTQFKHTRDCVIKLFDKNNNKSCYFVSTELPDKKVMLSMGIGSKGLANIIDICDSDLYRWVKDRAEMFDINDKQELEIEIIVKGESKQIVEIPEDIEIPQDTDTLDPEGYYDITDYREDYLLKHNRMRILQEPIQVHNLDHSWELYKEFLHNDQCNKLIFSFCIFVPYPVNHNFTMDLTIDKLVVFTRTFISFNISRPDIGIEYKDNNQDIIIEYDENIKNIIETFYDQIKACYLRCSVLSNREVYINAFSNIKLGG